MAKKKKKWLITLTEVNEETLNNGELPRLAELTSLPEKIDDALQRIAPTVLDLKALYLLTDRQKDDAIDFLEQHSLPYHDYAVDDRGERCSDETCDRHAQCVVIQLHDRRQRHQGA